MGHTNMRSKGFTLVEVMTVVAVIAILAALAGPSFAQLIAKQRGKAVASELFTALYKTRSEAITRNAAVTIMAKPGGWQNGWEIHDPVVVATVIEDRGVATATAIAGPSSPASVTFQASGRLNPGDTPVFLVTNTVNATSFYQCISLALSGRPYMKAAQTC